MKHLLLVFCSLFIFSCSVQKRHYQKGYFVSWKKTATGKTKANEKQSLTASYKKNRKENRTPDAVPTDIKLLSEISNAPTLNASQKNIAPHKKTTAITAGNDSCDILIYKDGSEIKIKVLEVTGTTVKYKKCDMMDGPTYIIEKSKLFMVKYTNGTNEVFKTQEPQNTYQQTTPTNNRRYVKKNTRLATLSLIFSILGFYPVILIGGIAAIIMSLIQLNLIQSNPDEYGGEKKTRVAFIMGVISVVLWVAIIGLIILAG